MDSRTLHNNIALFHRGLDTIVQNQLDLAFEHDSKVDALRAVHDVDLVLSAAGGREIHDAAEHARGVDEADLLAMHVGEGALRLCRHAICLEDVRETGNYACRRLAFRIEGVGWDEGPV